MTETADLLEHIRQLEHDLADCRRREFASRVLNPGQPETLIALSAWAPTVGLSRTRAYQLRDIYEATFPPVLLHRGKVDYYGRESLDWWNAKRLENYPLYKLTREKS